MEVVNGRFASAVVHRDADGFLEDRALAQIKMICDCDAAAGSRISIMPDAHPGKVGPIGLSMTVGGRVMPNLVGVDAGCGMTMARVSKWRGVDGKRLDSVIRERVPSGFDVRRDAHRFAAEFDFGALSCSRHVMREKAQMSVGTLGGGNHFIEVDEDGRGDVFITVHSGSRHLGAELTSYYLMEGRRALAERGEDVPFEMTWLDGALRDDYIHDLNLAREFAELNRRAIIDSILRGVRARAEDFVSCPHNFISEEDGALMLRKGAASAKSGERVVIPINMRDGVIVGRGKGNAEWNSSAPHGSGRVLSRADVRKSFTVSAFKKEMRGVWTTCARADTLDESPFAYRGKDAILGAISETVDVEEVLHPVYSFKAGGAA